MEYVRSRLAICGRRDHNVSATKVSQFMTLRRDGGLVEARGGAARVAM
jgi:hypothetical protein